MKLDDETEVEDKKAGLNADSRKMEFGERDDPMSMTWIFEEYESRAGNATFKLKIPRVGVTEWTRRYTCTADAVADLNMLRVIYQAGFKRGMIDSALRINDMTSKIILQVNEGTS